MTNIAIKLAFDCSLRRYDKEGRLHIELTPISKANICPYFGREIPSGDKLGLDPDHIYQMLRAPEELIKGASSSKGSMHPSTSTDSRRRIELKEKVHRARDPLSSFTVM